MKVWQRVRASDGETLWRVKKASGEEEEEADSVVAMRGEEIMGEVAVVVVVMDEKGRRLWLLEGEGISSGPEELEDVAILNVQTPAS